MSNYLVTAKAEVLYEKANDILAKYENYLNTNECPLECIKEIYNNLCLYAKKIILCEDEKTFITLNNNISEYDRIITNVYSSSSVGA